MSEPVGLDEALLASEQQRAESTSVEVDRLLADTEAVGALRHSIANVAGQLTNLYAENSDTNFVFVVGGKSRTLTEAMLTRVAASLPSDHPAVEAISRRIRLNDEQNKNLYGENTSTQQERLDAKIPSVMLEMNDEARFIICDDSMDTGKKAFHTLSNLNQHGVSASYIVFAGPAELSESTDYLRPANWEEFRQDIIVGTTDSKARTIISGLSRLLSTYANIRLNKNVYTWGQSIPATIDTLNGEHAQSLRASIPLMAKLKSAIA